MQDEPELVECEDMAWRRPRDFAPADILRGDFGTRAADAPEADSCQCS